MRLKSVASKAWTIENLMYDCRKVTHIKHTSQCVESLMPHKSLDFSIFVSTRLNDFLDSNNQWATAIERCYKLHAHHISFTFHAVCSLIRICRLIIEKNQLPMIRLFYNSTSGKENYKVSYHHITILFNLCVRYNCSVVFFLLELRKKYCLCRETLFVCIHKHYTIYTISFISHANKETYTA